MKHTPTEQQQTIVAASVALAIGGIMKIKAGAGSGKTSTLILTALANEVESIYLCFNSGTAEEARPKFPEWVEPRTSHSMAFEKWGRMYQHKLKRPTSGYVNVAFTGSEIDRYFNIGELRFDEDITMSGAFIGMLAKMTVSRFEQSADFHIEAKHVPMSDIKEKVKDDIGFTSRAREKVLWAAKMLWAERKNKDSKVLITHDTYLKMFQLSKPTLHNRDGVVPSILYVDEFQDTTPCVLDIVLRQQNKMKIIVVGDDRQAIYGWRGAVNAMQMVDAPSYPLTKSFRYGQAVADVATTVLERDMVLQGNEKIASIVGIDSVIKRSQPYTRLFRTNSSLLGSAIDAIKKGRSVSIEIDVKDFVKFLESAQALYLGDLKKVKHDRLLAFQTWEEAKAESKLDPDIGRAVMVIENGIIEDWIETLTSHVNPREPHITFTTAHKAKGREWEQVIVENDFRSCYNEDGEWVGLPREEQNLLYVALTRAILRLQINKTIQEYLDRALIEEAM